MLFRLVVAALVVGLGIFAFRAWRIRAARLARTLSAAELSALRALAQRSESLEEALSLREKVRALEGATTVQDGVEDAVRELAVKVELAARLARTASDLEAGATDEDLHAARQAAKAAPDEEARKLEEERAALLERQRASAEELERRREEIVRASERIVLGLREVHVALLELQASSGGGEGTAGSVRDRLQAASEELRRRAAAHDELKAFLEASKQG